MSSCARARQRVGPQRRRPWGGVGLQPQLARVRRVVQADREDQRGSEHGGREAHVGERMPRPARRPRRPARVRGFLPAVDEVLEPRGAPRRAPGRGSPLHLDDGQNGLRRRRGGRGRSASPTLPGSSDFVRAGAPRLRCDAQPAAATRAIRPLPLAQPRRRAGAPIPSARRRRPPHAGPAAPGPGGPVWLFGLLVLVLVWLVGYFLSALGPAASLIGLRPRAHPARHRARRRAARRPVGAGASEPGGRSPSRGAGSRRSHSRCSSTW